MRFVKSVLTVCFAFFILFSSVQISFAEEQNSANVLENEYGSKIDILNALNITSINLNDFSAESPVTREMFSKAIASMMLDDVSSVSIEPCGDLDEDDKGMLYLKSIGIIKGTSENVFEPDSVITVEQAAKIAVTLLGFDKISDYNGGYYAGYMAEAARIGLLDEINLSASNELSMGNFVNMLYNLLDIDLLEQKVFGSANKFHRVDGNTIISVYRNIREGEGIVSANKYSGLYSADDAAGGDRIAVLGEFYNVGDTNAEDYIGLHTEFYFRESKNGNEKTILYISSTNQNKRVFVNCDDIISYKAGVYTYENEKTKEIKIPNNAVIMYNGVFQPVLDAKKFIPSYGSVEFISNDGDSSYDVIKIEDITVTIVLSVTSDGYDIYDKYSTDYNIGLKESDYSLTLANGKKGTVSNIRPDNIVETVKSECADGVYLKMKVSADSAAGTVQMIETKKLTRVNENNLEETVIVPDVIYLNDKKYSVSKRLQQLIADGRVSAAELGKEYVFILNSRGEIADISSEGEKTFRIGYFKRFTVDESLRENKRTIRLFDESGTWETYSLAKKVKLNGVMTKEENINNLDDYIGTVCKYELNIAGEVTSLYFPSETDENFRTVYSMKDPYFRRYYGSPVFGPKSDDDGVTCSVKSTSVVFIIPNFAEDSVDEDLYGYQYAVIPLSKLPNYNSYSNVNIYNTEGDIGIGDVAVVKMKTHGYVLNENSTRPVLINKCLPALDGDEPKIKVTALSNGSEVSFFVEDLRKNGGNLPFKAGDLIFCFLSQDRTLRLYDDAKYYHILLDYDEENPVFAKAFDWNAGAPIGISYRSSMAGDVRIRYGSVYKTDGEYLWLNTSSDPADISAIEATKYTSARIYVYDKENKKYKLGSASDIIGYTSDAVNYSKAVVVYTDTYAEIVIY